MSRSLGNLYKIPTSAAGAKCEEIVENLTYPLDVDIIKTVKVPKRKKHIMVVYVVQSDLHRYYEPVNIEGVYSNLALAGKAAMDVIANEVRDLDGSKPVVIFECQEKPWGYLFFLSMYSKNSWWECGTIQIIRVTFNE